MFNDIAGQYDFLNHFLSLGIDKGWRRKAIAELKILAPRTILDVATGTGDLAIEAARLGPDRIVGVDIASHMLEVGRKKINSLGLTQLIDLQYGDSEELPFSDSSFDAITCAYGVRNFENLGAGLKEIYRVLKPGGKVVILEFSKPGKFPFRQLYGFYFRHILPVLGKLFSKHSRAYTYLPESVNAFPEGAAFCAILGTCGFKNPRFRSLTLGVTTLYTAEK